MSDDPPFATVARWADLKRFCDCKTPQKKRKWSRYTKAGGRSRKVERLIQSFFTGKTPKLGGIPHDVYGMTALSVQECVLGIYRKLNLQAETVRKLQTGGPDGDLGSNNSRLREDIGVLVKPPTLSPPHDSK